MDGNSEVLISFRISVISAKCCQSCFNTDTILQVHEAPLMAVASGCSVLATGPRIDGFTRDPPVNLFISRASSVMPVYGQVLCTKADSPVLLFDNYYKVRLVQ